MKLLARADHLVLATIWAESLRAAGIRCELRNTTLSGAMGELRAVCESLPPRCRGDRGRCPDGPFVRPGHLERCINGFCDTLAPAEVTQKQNGCGPPVVGDRASNVRCPVGYRNDAFGRNESVEPPA